MVSKPADGAKLDPEFYLHMYGKFPPKSYYSEWELNYLKENGWEDHWFAEFHCSKIQSDPHTS